MTGPAAVDRPEALTAAWLTDALQAGGNDLEVTDVRAERIGSGQMGATYRLTITYGDQAGPPTLVAKLPAEDEARRSLVAPGYVAEVGFYQHLAPTLDVRIPGCWYSTIDDDGVFTLVLDDASTSSPGVQADGCTIAQARASIANLVGLHAPHWNDPTLHDHEFLMSSDASVGELMAAALAPATEGFVERYDGMLSADDARTLRESADALAAWFVARPEPFAVVHGDYRLDNLLFADDGDEVIAVDWQSASVGPPLRDVAYFLGTCLEPEERRANEEDLIGAYHRDLLAAGVTDYELDRCWDDYRIGPLQGPMISVLGCMYATGERSDASDAMFLAMVRRSCAAIRELRSFELV